MAFLFFSHLLERLQLQVVCVGGRSKTVLWITAICDRSYHRWHYACLVLDFRIEFLDGLAISVDVAAFSHASRQPSL